MVVYGRDRQLILEYQHQIEYYDIGTVVCFTITYIFLKYITCGGYCFKNFNFTTDPSLSLSPFPIFICLSFTYISFVLAVSPLCPRLPCGVIIISGLTQSSLFPFILTSLKCHSVLD